MLALRRALPEAGRTEAAELVASHSLVFLAARPPATISVYAAIAPELDPGPLVARVRSAGYRVCLPVMVGRDRPLEFRAYAPGDALATTLWGIREPLATAPVVAPDVVITALLAVDRAGWRLGYGGGYFDRTLARLRDMKPVVAVGLAYDEQVIDAVPHTVYDQRLDWVLTPSGPFKPTGP
jgi:5-formyltetrahydrofolate cyclo-ligase